MVEWWLQRVDSLHSVYSSKIGMLTIYFRPVWSYAFTFLAGPVLVAVKQKDNIFVTACVHSY